MHYGNIKKNDIANGQGVRVTLFVSGCTNHCKNCFQPETWNFDYGKPYTKETEDEVIEALKPSHIGGRKHCEVTDEMLSLLDVLVDGPFREEEKDITLAFRGSRNQRVIDMQKSLKEKEVILYLS